MLRWAGKCLELQPNCPEKWSAEDNTAIKKGKEEPLVEMMSECKGWTPANILAQSSVSITSSAWDSPQLKHLRYLYQLVARARELMRDYSGSDRVGSNRIEANCIEMEMAWGIDPMCTLRRSKED